MGDAHFNRNETYRYAFAIAMTDNPNPFADISVERTISLRWMLRDIKANRTKLSPISESDMRTLIELGLVEMRDDSPALTNEGHAAC
jgi:hypothetical protein